MSICIPPELIENVKKIVSNPSSISRNKLLTELFGDANIAKEVNTAYEKSLLLSNQKTSLDKFINGFTELGQQAKQELRDKIATRLANRTDKIQNDELLSIAQDIWNRKYKLDIPLDSIDSMNKIKRESDILKKQMEGTPTNSPERMAYGRKLVELKGIVSGLKNPNESLGIGATAKKIASDTAARFGKEKGVLGNVGEGLNLAKDIATSAIYKSVQASADLSYSLRQGFKVLTKNPTVWKENWLKAFEPFKKIGSKAEQQKVADEFMASIVSHPLYQDAIDSKLAIGVIEDFFPTTLAEKIPGLGNIFKSSNEAFTIFSQGSRMGLFEDMVTKAKASGREITPQLMKDFAQLSNSLTGRGSLGKLEASSELINKIFYSGRYIKSSLDTFTMPFNTKLDPLVRKEAMKSSIATLGTAVGFMYTASLFTDVEWNPLSSKFGKAKVPGSKDTWIDLTAGLGSYIVAANKIAQQKSKSSTTGKVTELNSGKYGSSTTFDVAIDFFTNKLSPAPSTAVQFLKGRDYSGKKPTIASAATNLVTPISGGNIWQQIQSEDNDTSSKLISSVFDILGASQTDYTKFRPKK